ncbi:glycosyltransferase [Ascidiaceihabitans sp.]|nr:glycosyltransferase [Ascidiaceihabitans sp.]
MPCSVSVVVVSRDRPDALYLCVLCLSQVQYNAFEIVVVADAKGLAALDDFKEKIKAVQFDDANISMARNIGIVHSAGEIVAFIDDDAVPEPTWLTYLTAPFSRGEVSAVGGFAIGRNGISFQWKARVLDRFGFASKIDVDEENPTILTPPVGHAVKTEGTNMAVRRGVLVDLEGFDPAYHFHLDETDLNIRLAAANHLTAIAPLAQVHHGFAQSIRRRGDRVPNDLFDIGASWAVFQRKYIEEETRKEHWTSIVKVERKRLIGHMLSGGLEPRSIRRLLARLMEGYNVGLIREIGVGSDLEEPVTTFRPFPSRLRKYEYLSGRPLAAEKLRLNASEMLDAGKIVTVSILSATAIFHRVRFHREGYWEQSGGLWGKSNRTQRLVKIWSRKKRAKFEENRVRLVRSDHSSQ